MKKWLLGVLIITGLFLPMSYARARSTEPAYIPPPPEPAPGSLMGAEIVERASKWVDAGVPYNQAAYYEGYRTDCAGFVSYAWQVRDGDGRPHSPDGVTLGNQYGSPIPFDLLAPGDILDNMRYGNEGHAVLFVAWIEKGVSFEAYEENGGEHYSRAVATRLTLQALKSGGTTIAEYEPYAPGPYFAFRSQGIPGYAIVTGAPCVWQTPGECIDRINTGEQASVTFTIRNEGGSALVLRQLMAGARGPWARVQGWDGPNADFPPATDVIVQPGQSYTYTGTRAFPLMGDYFVEALLNEDGEWRTISPWPRASFDVLKKD